MGPMPLVVFFEFFIFLFEGRIGVCPIVHSFFEQIDALGELDLHVGFEPVLADEFFTVLRWNPFDVLVGVHHRHLAVGRLVQLGRTAIRGALGGSVEAHGGGDHLVGW